MRYGGASGQLTVRADSGFYTHSVVSVCCKLDVRFSITIRQHKSLRNLIEAIPEADWTSIPYWMDGAADVAEQGEPGAAPVRLIVAVPNWPSSPPTARLHEMLELEGSSPSRRDREPIRDLKQTEPHAVGSFRRQRRLR